MANTIRTPARVFSKRSPFHSSSTCRRTFASSTIRSNAFLDVVTTPPLAFMDTLHACGLPWWAIIPSTALAVRGLVFYSVGRKAQERAKAVSQVFPVAQTQRMNDTFIRNVLKAQGLLRKESGLVRMPLWQQGPLGVYFRSRTIAKGLHPELFKRAWLAPLTRIGAWLLAFDAIRMKLGMDNSILRALVDSVYSQEPSTAQAISQFDPDLQVQGLLWCTDLTAADPTGILQGTLFLVMATNILARPGRQYTPTWRAWFFSISQREWTFTLLIGVIYAFVWHLPAGLHLYLVSSVIIQRLQRAWLNTKYPLEPIPQRCAMRPVLGLTNIGRRKTK